jgi:hypothetical protein
MALGQLATLASPALARIQAVLLFALAQQLASLSIDEMQLGASRASDPFISVVGRVLIVRQQMLDVQRCRRTGENEMGHRQNMMAPRYYTMM